MTALVTGAGKRLGRAMALYLAGRGHDVAVHYASSAAEAETVVAEISDRSMVAICAQLNNTPRKCLGWQTPTEAFRTEIMNLR